jgi:hypothetical protein
MKLTFWLRLFFLLVLVQALSIGRALIWPETIGSNLPWDASPLNARFIAALYVMGAISSLVCMFAARYAEVRITLIEVTLLTGGLLLLTLPHVGEFAPDRFPYRWIILYIIDPIVGGLILWRLRGRDAAPAGRNPLSPILAGYAAVLGVIGAVLLALPELAAQLWPWALPPILGQVYSIFFLTFAAGGLLAARDPRWEAIWIYLTANLSMLLLIIAVSVYHAARFKPGPPTWLWYGLCIAGVVALTVALVRRPRRIVTKGAAK